MRPIRAANAPSQASSTRRRPEESRRSGRRDRPEGVGARSSDAYVYTRKCPAGQITGRLSFHRAWNCNPGHTTALLSGLRFGLRINDVPRTRANGREKMKVQIEDLFHEVADLGGEARVRYFDEHSID